MSRWRVTVSDMADAKPGKKLRTGALCEACAKVCRHVLT